MRTLLCGAVRKDFCGLVCGVNLTRLFFLANDERFLLLRSFLLCRQRMTRRGRSIILLFCCCRSLSISLLILRGPQSQIQSQRFNRFDKQNKRSTTEHLREDFGIISQIMPTILVTDALGVVGHRVAQKLLAAGHRSVRVGVSDLTKANRFKEQGAQVVAFDFDRPSSRRL